MRKRFTHVALDAADLVFGKASIPLERAGVTIGGGNVIPEIKFTLPEMKLEDLPHEELRAIYSEMATGVCRRAVELHQPALVLEFELLPPMTLNPAVGEMVTRVLRGVLDEFRTTHGLLALLRVTPVDIREQHKPPRRREGLETGLVFDSFRRCAEAGGDLLSIESTGGKEVTDPSIMSADIRGILFGTVVLGCADMEFLWENIARIAGETGTIPAGDTACGIGNTAMVLADQGYIPKVFAAVVRAVTAVRSLVAYEVGAVGPGKDCGYENAILKAITGYPMSMEGKSASCAHFSSLGNIAGAYADLWSNESVQNVRLLSGPAPVVSMEQLIYDCRLMNVSTNSGEEMRLREWFVESDAHLDPQAFIFRPDVIAELAAAIISEEDDYWRGVYVARRSVQLLEQGVKEKSLSLTDREREWLGRIRRTLDELPPEREQFVEEEKERWKELVDYSQYGMQMVRV